MPQSTPEAATISPLADRILASGAAAALIILGADRALEVGTPHGDHGSYVTVMNCATELGQVPLDGDKVQKACHKFGLISGSVKYTAVSSTGIESATTAGTLDGKYTLPSEKDFETKYKNNARAHDRDITNIKRGTAVGLGLVLGIGYFRFRSRKPEDSEKKNDTANSYAGARG